MIRVIAVIALSCAVGCVASEPSCADFDARIDSGDSQRAAFGTRIVAPAGFADYTGGTTYQIPTGTLVMEPWVDHGTLGAIGVDAHESCYWYTAGSP